MNGEGALFGGLLKRRSEEGYVVLRSLRGVAGAEIHKSNAVRDPALVVDVLKMGLNRSGRDKQRCGYLFARVAADRLAENF